MAKDLYGAAAGLYQSQKHFHCSAFACAVGAEEAIDASLRDFQIHIADAVIAVIAFAQIVCFYCEFHNFLLFPCCFYAAARSVRPAAFLLLFQDKGFALTVHEAYLTFTLNLLAAAGISMDLRL